MRLLTIVGKVDTRVLSYPIARALSLQGLTALISDDGAYRRLYHGDGNKGTVSNIDISVGANADENLKNSLNDSGIQYDNVVFVSSGYIPADSSGVIVCHGADRSMMGVTEQEEERKIEHEKKEESSKKSEKNKGSNDTEDKVEDSSEEVVEKGEKKDKIVVPDGIPSVEVQISYSTPSYKGLTSILLRDSFINYIYSCEERKEIVPYADKAYNKMLAKILNTTLNIDAIEALKLLERSEYIRGSKK